MKKIFKLFLFSIFLFLVLGYRVNADCGECNDCTYYNISYETNEGELIKDISTMDENSSTGINNDSTSNTLLGDVNLDGKITQVDAFYLLMYTFFPDDYPLTEEGLINADVNLDGVISDADAVVIHSLIKDDIIRRSDANNTVLCTSCEDFQNFELPLAKREGYTFDGWYADRELSVKISNPSEDWSKVNTEEIFDGNGCTTNEIKVNLYAKWIKDSSVEVPDTNVSTNILLIILASSIMIIGLIIIVSNIKHKYNNNI